MKVLLIHNQLSEASRKLADQYTAWRGGDILANGELVEIVRGRWWPSPAIPGAWGDMSDNTVQTYQVMNMGFQKPSNAHDADIILLSSHFPIRVWGINNIPEKDVGPIQQAMGGRSSAFDHFVSQWYFSGKPVFRLDGSTDGEVMERWLQRLINAASATWDDGTWIIDTDPGVQHRDTDQKYDDAFDWLDEHGLFGRIDRSPTQPELDPERKYAGYLGWYDEIPNRYFEKGDWTGAFGWHLRSGTFRNHNPDAVNWVTEPIKNGFAFVLGSVYEPGLVYPDPVEFLRRVYQDRELVGLAAWNLSVIRSELCFVGDPLWSPYDMSTSQPVEPPKPPNPPAPELIASIPMGDGRILKIIIE